MIGLVSSPIFTVGMLVVLLLVSVGAALVRMSGGSSVQRLMGCGQLLWLGVALLVVLVVWTAFAFVQARLSGNYSGPGNAPASHTPIPWSTITTFGTPTTGGSISSSP